MELLLFLILLAISPILALSLVVLGIVLGVYIKIKERKAILDSSKS